MLIITKYGKSKNRKTSHYFTLFHNPCHKERIEKYNNINNNKRRNENVVQRLELLLLTSIMFESTSSIT